MKTTGHSTRSLAEKLGIREKSKIVILNPPENYDATLGELPNNDKVLDKIEAQVDFIHFFTKSREELEIKFPSFKEALSKNGILWVSWPKQSSGVETDLGESSVRNIGLENGLVDVKVCSIDKTWSGLKFVRMLKDRKQFPS